MSRPSRTALVSMPFAAPHYPNFQVGLLKACLKEEGITCDAFELNLRLYKRLGHEIYGILARNRYVGDAIFSRAPYELSIDAITEHCTRISSLSAKQVKLVCAEADAFLEDVLSSIAWEQYSVVGFTLTHMQTCAALSLAMLLKRLDPRIHIVFGGASAYKELGEHLIKAFDWIDSVVDGAGEDVLPQIIRQASEQSYDSSGTRRVYKSEDPVNLNRLPVPDYDHYFEEQRRLSIVLPEIFLPVEGSRGCWWNKCGFCALNNGNSSYQQKAASNIANEFYQLSEKYSILRFHFADSIQPTRGWADLASALVAHRRDYSFMMEIYATVKRSDLEGLRKAGLNRIQLGVESFSDNALREMKKGVDTLRNIRVLRWCLELGIRVQYNLITNLPGETAQDIDEALELIPSLQHLEPPSSVSPYLLNYGSPDFVRLEAGDGHLFKSTYLPAYLRQTPGLEAQLPAHRGPAWDKAMTHIEQWQKSWSPHAGLLSYRDGGRFLFIVDLRQQKRREYRLRDIYRDTLLALESIRTRAEVYSLIGASRSRFDLILSELLKRGLIIERNERLLSLVPRSRSGAEQWSESH